MKPLGFFCWVILAVFSVALAGCQTSNSSHVGTNSPIQPSAVSHSTGIGGYKLGSGDKVRVIVFGEENLSGEFVVDDAGNVSLPLIGNVPARGKSVQDLQENVAGRYRNGYLRDPKISIEVLNYRPFFITGEVKKTGEFPYKAGLTVQDAVGVAGGYTYRANTGKAYVRRAGQNGENAVDLGKRIPINPGDSIRIPERFF